MPDRKVSTKYHLETSFQARQKSLKHAINFFFFFFFFFAKYSMLENDDSNLLTKFEVHIYRFKYFQNNHISKSRDNSKPHLPTFKHTLHPREVVGSRSFFFLSFFFFFENKGKG